MCIYPRKQPFASYHDEVSPATSVPTENPVPVASETPVARYLLAMDFNT